jgi:hypothetical protein
MKFYSERQITRATKARNLYHALGAPSLRDFKIAIQGNFIRNCPVKIADINLAEKIFGSDIGTFKGKSTRRTPLPIAPDYVDIPQELILAQREVTLYIDGMFVNNIPFLSSISEALKYRMVDPIDSFSTASISESLKTMIQAYNVGGFHIAEIHADEQCQPALENLATKYKFRYTISNPQDHVPQAERNNRTIKERVRAVYHRLPYNHLPRAMVRVMVTEAGKKLNFSPLKVACRNITAHAKLSYIRSLTTIRSASTPLAPMYRQMTILSQRIL